MEMPNQNQSNKNPKKKIIIALSVIAVVIIGLIAASTLVDPPLFKGLLSPSIQTVAVTDTVEKESTILDTKEDTELKTEPVIVEPIDTKLDTELKTEPVIVAEPVEKSEEEPEPIELAPIAKEVVQATPPDISFAYLDRFDAEAARIYGHIVPGKKQAQLIFRVRNTGTMPAYLKSFATREYGCDNAPSCYIGTRDGQLNRFSYDESGAIPDYDPTSLWNIGFLRWNQDTSSFGHFEDPDPTNNSLLEITGNSDTYFVVFNDTDDFFYPINTALETKYRQSFIDLATFKVVDSNGVELSFSIDSADTVTPGTMTYYNPANLN